jgi:hypothetical protein
MLNNGESIVCIEMDREGREETEGERLSGTIYLWWHHVMSRDPPNIPLIDLTTSLCKTHLIRAMSKTLYCHSCN